MDWFIAIVGVLLLVIGTAITLWWWRLVRRAAPYRDEPRGAARREPADDGAEVIVLPPVGEGRRGGVEE